LTAKTRKALIVTVKLIVATALLTWVLSQVHWRDYAAFKDTGEAAAIHEVVGPTEAPQALAVSTGALWWRSERQTHSVSQFEPIEGGAPGDVIRRGVRTLLLNIRRSFLLYAAGLHVFIALAQAVRWWCLLRVQEIPATLGQTVRVTFVGLFFNFILPGTFGGDLLRAYYMAKNSAKKETVILSLFVERTLGLAELGALAAVMLVVALVAGLATFDELKMPAVCVVVLTGIVGTALAILLSSRLRAALRLDRLYDRLPLADRIQAVGQAARTYRRHVGALLIVLAICLMMHICFVSSILLVGKSLAVDIPWHSYFIFIPLIYILGAVPITPGGVGLIEKLYLTFFVMVSPSALLAMALLARLLPVVACSPGLVMFFMGPHPKLGKIEADLSVPSTEGAEI